MNQHLVPTNTKGKMLDLEDRVSLPGLDEAKALFEKAMSRLLHPNGWKELCGGQGAEFILMDKKGIALERAALPGDYLRINIPGPGPQLGDNFDWVKVELIDQSLFQRMIGLKLVTCSNPLEPDNEASHFFETGASSSFIIRQKEKEVIANYYGRNETANNHTENTHDNIRNTAIALAAKAGMSSFQWSHLLKGLLKV